MTTRRQIRSFTISANVSDRLDEICLNLRGQYQAALIAALGLNTGPDKQLDSVDEHDLTEKDYATLRQFSGLAATGTKLLTAVMLSPSLRVKARRLISCAQRVNQKARKVHVSVNASRVAEALLRLGLASIDKTKSASPPPPTVTKQSPVTDRERQFAPCMHDSSRKAFILAAELKPKKKAAKNATIISAGRARRHAGETA